MTILADTSWLTAETARWLLPATLLTPLIGVALIPLMSRAGVRSAYRIALIVSLLGAVVAGALVWAHLADASAVAGVQRFAEGWFVTEILNTSLALSVDGISVWLVALTALLMPLAILGSARSIREHQAAYYMLMLLLQTAMLGVFLARDLLWFYIFFEFTLIPLFFVISIWGGPQRRQAAYKFFVYTLVGSMLTLAGILFLGVRAGGFAFDQVAATAGDLSLTLQVVLFLAFFAGFAIKVPLFPLHTWLPLAHTEAPTAGSVVLAGVLLKLGTYGFLRIGIDFMPAAALAVAPWMAALAVAGILYGALGAWVQSDIKKLVAYSSISHLGFCMLGLFALRPEGLVGGVLVMINHGLSTGALFLVIGMIYERYHTRQMDAIGGLGRRMPVISFFLVLFALSSLGLPGLNGFVSEFLVLMGAFISGAPSGGLPATLGIGFAAVAALGVILSAVYLLHMIARVVFGPLNEPVVHDVDEDKLPADATTREWAIMLPLGVLVVLLGLWPKPLTDSMRQPVDEILAGVQKVAAPENPTAITQEDPRGE
jgi:NADH-quinone oxidoreductase subunit M